MHWVPSPVVKLLAVLTNFRCRLQKNREVQHQLGFALPSVLPILAVGQLVKGLSGFLCRSFGARELQYNLRRTSPAVFGCYSLRAAHSGGVNVGYADGSVYFILVSIDTGNLIAPEMTSGQSPYGVWRARLKVGW